MNDLVQIRRNDVYTTSLVIAEGTNILHRTLKRTIRNHESFLEAFGLLETYLTESSGGRPEEFYLLNEQQATFLITLLKNTETVVAFKLELVRQFYAMRKFILEKQSEEWKSQRSDGKVIRREETDVIRQLVEYAKRQGSQNADRLYITYSTLAQKTAGMGGDYAYMAGIAAFRCMMQGMKASTCGTMWASSTTKFNGKRM